MTDEKFFSPKEKEALIRIIDAIPDSDHFVHNDLHTQNVMINDKKELMLIDMAEITRGHAIFDLGCTYMTLVFSPKLSGKLGKEVTGMTKKQSKQVWDILIRSYCHSDPAKIREMERICKYMRNMRLATLIARTSVFPAIAYRVCARWTKFFVIRHEKEYIRAFQNLE